jgi:chromosome segregation ATPase
MTLAHFRLTRDSFVAAALLLAFAITSMGCATRGHLRAQTASDSIATAANQVDNARRHLAETTTALRAHVSQPEVGTRAAYERFRNAVAALERSVAAVNAEAENIQWQGQRYFEHWNAQVAEMRNEDIRARSVSRQQEVSRQFAQLQQQYQQARQEFVPLMTTLRDIQRLISADLTPTGIEGAREFAARAEQDAARVQETLDRLAETFRQMSGVLSFPDARST